MVIDTVEMKESFDRENEAWKLDNKTYPHTNDAYIRNCEKIRKIEELVNAVEKQ